MQTVSQYGRWFETFADVVDRVCFHAPDGAVSERPVFRHQPGQFDYDERGYEILTVAGQEVLAVRFTPSVAGEWRYEACKGDTVVAAGQFLCVASTHPGYVGISRVDPRYFACSSGSSYVPIGANLIGPVRYPL